jgi:hypothetical protein
MTPQMITNIVQKNQESVKQIIPELNKYTATVNSYKNMAKYFLEKYKKDNPRFKPSDVLPEEFWTSKIDPATLQELGLQ